MSVTSRRALAMPAIVPIAGFTATGPSVDADDPPDVHHRHAGPCVAGDPAAALGHYNVDPLGRSTPGTEVWLDVTVDDGRASATASVPFAPLPGTRSVVIHAEASDPGTGAAGPRLASLPVVW